MSIYIVEDEIIECREVGKVLSNNETMNKSKSLTNE